MTTLITGGSGFIGLAIAERLIAEGEQVILFDLTAPSQDMLARPELAGAMLITGDVRNADDIDRALASARIDRVIHTAAMTPNAQREHDAARQIVDVNIGGTVNLLERIIRQRTVTRVTVLSSVAVYGFSQPAPSGLFEEDLSPPAPAALYGITKLASEQAALRVADLHKLDVRVIRLGPVFGPWELRTGVRDALSPHHQIVALARVGREIVLPRTMASDWIYSRDAACGIVAVSQSGDLAHRIYHVSGGGITDLPQWCAVMAQHFPDLRWRLAASEAGGNIVYGLSKDRAALNVARLAADTAWQPRFGLDQAAHDYLAWMHNDGAAA
ncbi:NAD(P)-dependent oxidoreductase [Rhodopseudomonas boonkerdii]|uniref:NAD-dependent epimerase/dehydratase family protein n=1 Tax=Rhodopseudomonas boonkerdii TaxID=475937 RepID=UPI001E2EE867|nr:NAD(P)-dependent oxidoreductase [Rhodopseudomonas boonkerdii]UGV27608.1 NAD(P)-dependent oxidoreductase [Rhodopseudomonas boonkerdii]